MDTQGKKWYGSRNMKVPDPTKVITPYGGRLIWTLPGSTQVVCHLKVWSLLFHKQSHSVYINYKTYEHIKNVLIIKSVNIG